MFVPLVGALVFKTSGGFEQSSQWVRFPYTPAPDPDPDLALLSELLKQSSQRTTRSFSQNLRRVRRFWRPNAGGWPNCANCFPCSKPCACAQLHGAMTWRRETSSIRGGNEGLSTSPLVKGTIPEVDPCRLCAAGEGVLRLENIPALRSTPAALCGR